jgi:hypothetical protein
MDFLSQPFGNLTVGGIWRKPNLPLTSITGTFFTTHNKDVLMSRPTPTEVILQNHQAELRAFAAQHHSNVPLKIVLDATPPWAFYRHLTHAQTDFHNQPRDASLSTAIFSGLGTYSSLISHSQTC